MQLGSEKFDSDVLNKVPHLVPVMREVEEIEFLEEISKLNKLTLCMYENTVSTSVALNRVIIYVFFNCILRTVEMKRGFVVLVNEGILPSAFMLNRAIFELWGAACFAEKTVRDFHVSRDVMKLDQIANKLFAGVRYPARLPWGEPSTEKPIHINDMLAELGRRYPWTKGTYGFLCEYCHPNFLYPTEAYLASNVNGLWANPLFVENITLVLEKQLSSLAQALRGIRACSKAIADICLEEYGLDYP